MHMLSFPSVNGGYAIGTLFFWHQMYGLILLKRFSDRLLLRVSLPCVEGVRSCYDEGKRVAETLCFDFHRQHNIAVRVARIFNTFGPGMHPYGEKQCSLYALWMGTRNDLEVCRMSRLLSHSSIALSQFALAPVVNESYFALMRYL